MSAVLSGIGIILVLAFVIALALVAAAVIVATSGAMFLDTGWIDGWHAAWNRPGFLLLFAMIVSALFGTRAQSKR